MALNPLRGALGPLGVRVAETGSAFQAEAEAALSARVHGARVQRVDDVGVAGLHRLLDARPVLDRADCLVVVAGMEGALPTAVGGLVAGAAFVLRYLSGGRAVLRAAVPVDPAVPLGLGLVLATLTSLSSLATGGQLLESGVLELDLPVLGLVKATTVLPFDTGVYLVVVGLVMGGSALLSLLFPSVQRLERRTGPSDRVLPV